LDLLNFCFKRGTYKRFLAQGDRAIEYIILPTIKMFKIAVKLNVMVEEIRGRGYPIRGDLRR